MESAGQNQSLDFFEYWDSFGFFDAIQVILPPDFMVLFDIARILFSSEVTSDAYQAIEEQLQSQAEDSFEKQVDGQ